MKDQLQEGEEIAYVAHPSRLPLVPLAILLVLAAAAATIGFTYPNEVLAIGGLVVAVVVLLRLIQRLMVLSSNKYVVTNRRVVRQGGILTRYSVDSYLDKINNVEHRQTLWGRMLGYGDVEIDTASETGATSFRTIAKPLQFKNAILTAMETYRSSRFGVAAAPVASGAEKIRELKTLFDDGLISAEEYEAKRKELLAGL